MKLELFATISLPLPIMIVRYLGTMLMRNRMLLLLFLAGDIYVSFASKPLFFFQIL